jgi:hypothetical protein
MFEIHARSMQIFLWTPRFLWFGLLVCVALLTARWMTELVSPRPVAALPVAAATASPVTVEDIMKVFEQAGAMTPQTADLALTGVYVKRGNKGFATFQSSQGPRLVHVGGEIHPGLVLAAVAADRVTLRGNGSEWQLEMKSGPGLSKAGSPPNPPRK